ncbi:MAG: prolipoprotein diacylglyceryl transferase [Kiritimatiellae bacterium]|nr:prolipoprotein diacylglyceryl transferase [Kiritimatiellia bacterium]
MFPELFSIGPITLKTYGLCMALGFLAAWQVLSYFAKKAGKSPDSFSNLLILMMVSGIVGSRIAYVIEHWQKEFASHPELIIRVDQGGLMFYGGLILSILTFLIWCKCKKEPIVKFADMMAVVIPLGHAFGRIGCFFFGCCYGKVSDCACAISFPAGSPAWHEQVSQKLIESRATESLPVLPTQLFESISVLLLFIVLFFLYKKFGQKYQGLITGAYLSLYALIRFGLECLRGDPRAGVGVLSIGQTISSILLVIGLVFVVSSILIEKRLNGKKGF